MIKRLALIAGLFSALAGAQTTTQPMLLPHQTFVDASGVPCSGCKLYSYAAGTTTPLATYSDAAGVVPNTNPVVLDVAGGATIWLKGNAYKFSLKTATGSSIWTTDNVTGYLQFCNTSGCTFTSGISGTSASFSSFISSASTISGGPTIDPRYVTYGAHCDWNGSSGTDDTASMQAAADAAHTLYVATGTPVDILVPKGCVVAGTITYGSGVHWVGPGSIIVPNQSTPSPHATLMAQNADNIAVENVTVQVVTPCAGNNAACTAIGWQDTGSDVTAHAHAYFRHNTVLNSDWGIYATYSSGSGSLTDVSISDNTVSSPAGAYSNADGIHVGGRVTNFTVANNRISNRNDAGIGLTSEGSGTYVLSGGTVTGNTLREDRVGIDCSGCTDTTVTSNFVKATIASPGNSNPAYREIYYNGYPSNVNVSNNYFENPGSVDGNVAKIDPILAAQVSWPNIKSTFTGNTIGGVNGILYARGNGISIANNTFLISGGGIILDYDGADSVATANVTIGTNRFQAAGVVTFGGGCALYSNVNYYPQQSIGSLTVSNVACIGSQTVNFPGTISLATNSLQATANQYLTIKSGPGSPTEGLAIQDNAGNNLLIVDPDGSGINVPDGPINTSFYYKMGGGSNGGLRNSGGTTVVPGTATDYMGTSATVVAMAEAKTMTVGDCLQVGTSGGIADSGVPGCGGGGGGGNATSIQGVAVSAVAPTNGQVLEYNGTNWIPFTTAGTGTVTSVALTIPSWLSVAGSPVTTAGTLAVTAATGQTSHKVVGTCGTATSVTLCSIVAGDLPATIGPSTTFLTNAEFSNGTCTTAKTIDPANGNKQKVTLTNADTCALTFTQPASGTATVQLKITQSAAGGFDGGISGCKWPGGVVPTITQTTGAIDMLNVYLDGTNAYCQIAQAFS